MTEEIESIRQTGTIFDYCIVFQDWFKRVQISEGFSDFYGVYLFICGLEPRIWDVFASWHQYSCNTVDEVISLALKIDDNGLRDSFSPFDPESSFYNKDLEWDTTITLDELMKDNEFFKSGKIQKVCEEDLVQEISKEDVNVQELFDDNNSKGPKKDDKNEMKSENMDNAHKVFDGMPERGSDEIQVQISVKSETGDFLSGLHENVIVMKLGTIWMDIGSSVVMNRPVSDDVLRGKVGSLSHNVLITNSHDEVMDFHSFGEIMYLGDFWGQKSLKEGVVGMGMVMDNFGWKPGWIHCLNVVVTLEIVNESEVVKSIEEVSDDVVSVVTRIGLLSKNDMVKRLFVFSNIEFDQASNDSWETDYEVVQRKFKNGGYAEVLGIVFWDLRDSPSTQVTTNQKGVALLSRFLKNSLTMFLEGGGKGSSSAKENGTINFLDKDSRQALLVYSGKVNRAVQVEADEIGIGGKKSVNEYGIVKMGQDVIEKDSLKTDGFGRQGSFGANVLRDYNVRVMDVALRGSYHKFSEYSAFHTGRVAPESNLDTFNLHSLGKFNFKSELVSYREKVVDKEKQLNKDSKQRIWYKEKIAKQERNSEALEDGFWLLSELQERNCGASSWGAYLLKRNIITMTFAPKVTHEVKVSVALEGGVPAIIGIMGSQGLPHTSRAFNMDHCTRCLITWTKYDELYILEVDRILSHGGYGTLSGPPIRREMWKDWNRTSTLQHEQDESEELGCKELETYIRPLLEVSSPDRILDGATKKWQDRATLVSPRIKNNLVKGIMDKNLSKDNELWNDIATALPEGKFSNIMDMNAYLGGFLAALMSQKNSVGVMRIAKLPLSDLKKDTEKEIKLRLQPLLYMLKIKDKDRGPLTINVTYHQFPKEEEDAAIEEAQKLFDAKKRLKAGGVMGGTMDIVGSCVKDPEFTKTYNMNDLKEFMVANKLNLSNWKTCFFISATTSFENGETFGISATVTASRTHAPLYGVLIADAYVRKCWTYNTTHYSTAIDMWSVGCIFTELVTHTAISVENSKYQRVLSIFSLLGIFIEEIGPGVSQLKVWYEFFLKSLFHVLPQIWMIVVPSFSTFLRAKILKGEAFDTYYNMFHVIIGILDKSRVVKCNNWLGRFIVCIYT